MSIENMPRRIDTVTLLLDEQILDESFESGRFEQPFFCGCGTDFIISFNSEDEATQYAAAQCPTCTALAPTFPGGEADPALVAPDLPTNVACINTARTVRESLAQDALLDLAVAAA